MTATKPKPSKAKAEPKRINLTRATIGNLRPPADERVYWWDTKQPGLAVCITAAGQRTFYVYRKINGQPKRFKLGRFPDLSVEQARKQAAAALGQIAVGQDPHGANLQPGTSTR